jgi:hypothetical protein
MKFHYNETCGCGGRIAFTTNGDNRFPDAQCASCGIPGHLIDALSPSVVADRLIRRSKDELDGGDYSLAILLSAIAVETFLTRIFLKLKGMQHFAGGFEWPDEAQAARWEQEYPRSGGFIGPANFVSNRLVQTSFDQFVATNPIANAYFDALPNSNLLTLSSICQNELFTKRNRIAHWGYVNSTKEEAEQCLGGEVLEVLGTGEVLGRDGITPLVFSRSSRGGPRRVKRGRGIH